MRTPDDVKLIEQPGRCLAIVKWINNWRCERAAVEGGLCRQHMRHGASMPERWQHWRNGRGVICCDPVGPRKKVSGK